MIKVCLFFYLGNYLLSLRGEDSTPGPNNTPSVRPNSSPQ